MDLETTGLSPLIDKIIEIAAIKITPQNGVEIFSELINPEIPIPEYTIDIHGISDQMVESAATIRETLPNFLEFIEDLPLIAHNAKFDLGFLIFQMHQLELPLKRNKIYCSVHQSRKSIEDCENYKLGTLAKFLDVALESHHRATDDALASMRIFAHCIEKSNHKISKHLYDFSHYDQGSTIELPENLNLLYDALPIQKELLMKYKGGSMKNQWRAVKPVSVLPMPQGSILYAKCLHSDLYKSFSLKKITDVMHATAEEIIEVLKK